MAVASSCKIVPPAALQQLVEQAKLLLEPYASARELFLLLVDSSNSASVALVLAAGLLKARCILLHVGRRHKVGHVLNQTGCGLVLEYDSAAGRLVEQRHSPAHVDPESWLQELQPRVSTDDDVVCILTSGSTGEAKVVVYTWEAVWLQARETVTRVLSGGTSWFVVTTPVSHAYNMNGLFTAYLAGSTLCLAFSADAVAECASQMPLPSETHTNVLFGSPPLFANLLNVGASRLPSWPIDQTYCAGSPLQQDVWEAFRERFSRCIRQNYGTSETGNIALYARDEDESAAETLGTGYKGIAWGEVTLKPPHTGAVLKDGEGEICVRVPWMSEGYVEGGAFVPHHYWYRTGDAGVLDGLRVYVRRRLRAPFRVRHGPLNIIVQADEVEQLYHEHITEAEGVAATQPAPGEGIMAHIALGSAYAESQAEREKQCAALLHRLRTSLGTEWGYVLPDAVAVYRALPSSPAGKLLYSDLEPHPPQS